MGKYINVDILKDKLDNQLKNCHGYTGNKKEVYKEAILAVKSMIKSENCIELEENSHE